mgnify:FL=1
MIPSVISVSKSGKEGLDLLSYDFIKNRKIYLFSEITDEVAIEVIAQLEYLDNNGTEEIKVYINSPGGSVSAGFAIVDAINRCRCDVSTICTGMAASMGAFILSCGTKGKRFATPLSEVMIHQPLGGAQGQASDIQLAAEHITKVKNRLHRILSENTGQNIKTISQDCDRDFWMGADEALKYGIIDGILS